MSGRAGTSVGMSALAAAMGVALALTLLPHTRNTMSAELALALGHRPEWMRGAFVAPSGRPQPAVERVLAEHPEDVELQVGGATLPSALPEGRPLSNEEQAARRRADARRIIARLAELEQRFPNEASLRAHLLRHLCAEAIVLQRPEERVVTGAHPPAGAASPDPSPTPQALQLFEEAAAEGARLEPENGFFESMAAVAAFAGKRDAEALGHLHRAAASPRWNDYRSEQIRTQWRLLQQAYGPRGWLQKIPGVIHAVGFYGTPTPDPAIRSMANLALWHAWQRERAGDARSVRQIRGDVMRLGERIRDGSAADERGRGLRLIRSGSGPVPFDDGLWYGPPDDKRLWIQRAPYLHYLRAHGMAEEARWVEEECRRADAMQKRLDQALYSKDASFRTMIWLGVGWAVGLLLLWQMGGLLLLWAAAAGLARVRRQESATERLGLWLAVCLLLCLTPLTLVARLGESFMEQGGLGAGVTAWMLVMAGAIRFLIDLRARHSGEMRWVVVGLWLAGYLAVFLIPLVLVVFYGPSNLLWGYLGGVVLLGLLGIMHRASHQVVPDGLTPRWRPGLVALAAMVLAAPAILFAPVAFPPAWDVLANLQIFPSYAGEHTLEGVRAVMVLLPGALLVFLQLCRVAALRLPFFAGLGRGLCQTTPYAIGLLTILYLATLAPTVAAERTVEQHLEQAITISQAGS